MNALLAILGLGLLFYTWAILIMAPVPHRFMTVLGIVCPYL